MVLRRAETAKRRKTMTMLAIVGIAFGVVLIVAAIVYTRRSRKNQEPLSLGVGGKLRP
jgi:hypothetical protein